MPTYFGGPGVQPSLKTGTNRISLASGQTWLIQPAGWYYVTPGPYTCIQQFDTILQTWVTVGGNVQNGNQYYFWSDGDNYRLANLTGCAVGALLTNAGTAYTSAPTWAASAGSSKWLSIMGQTVSSITISNAGSGYTYPPTIIVAAPPSPGIVATAHCTLSAGTISTIVMDNVGGGYTSPPTIQFLNDPREGVNNIAVGTGAAGVAVLGTTQTVTGLICIDPGTGGLTSVPTLTPTGGGGSSVAATAIMCWTIASFTVTGGTNFTFPALLSGLDAFPTTAAAYVNPATQSQWVKTRLANIFMNEVASAPTASSAVFYDRGIYTSAATPLLTTSGELITQTATITLAFGGTTDVSYISS